MSNPTRFARPGRLVVALIAVFACFAALIERVVFRLDGKRISSQTKSPFKVLIRALPGKHNVTARVTFKDATRAKTLKLGYRACAAAVAAPRRGPSQFTG